MQNHMVATRDAANPTKSDIVLTRADYRELLPLTLLSRHPGDVGDQLAEKLETAMIVDSSSVPADVVTLNTEFELRDEASGYVSRLILVHPREANIVAGRISVLSPVGAALLGMAAGASTRIVVPSGEEKRLSIARVLMQPESRANRAIR